MEEMPSLNISVQRLKVAILPLDLTQLWTRNPFRGNFNHWQVSRKEAGQIWDAHAQQKKRVNCHIKHLNFCLELTSSRKLSNKLDKTMKETKGANLKFWK